MRNFLKTLKTPLPIWVSRKRADGLIAHFDVPIGVHLVVGFLALSNAVIWGFIGLVIAAKMVF